jgi:hypothetical protein
MQLLTNRLALTSTTSHRRQTVSVQTNGTSCSSTYNAITITVQDVVTAGTIKLQAAQTICNGDTPAAPN